MGILTYLFILFGIPSVIYTVCLGALGFWRRDAQIVFAIATGITAFWIVTQFASSDSLAPFFILPFIAVYFLATVAGFWLASALRRGHAKSAVAEATGID